MKRDGKTIGAHSTHLGACAILAIAEVVEGRPNDGLMGARRTVLPISKRGSQHDWLIRSRKLANLAAAVVLHFWTFISA